MTVSLDAAVSGLLAAQQQMNVVADNISNATTPGYTEKTLQQSDLILGNQGVGVQIGNVTRNVNLVLQRDLFTQTSTNSAASVTQKYLDQLQTFNGPANGAQSLSAVMDNLATSFSTLSSQPDSTLLQNQTLAAAQQMASTFNTSSNFLSQLRSQTETQISGDIGTINQALTSISQLNQQINTLTAEGQSAADLEDQRDQAVATVSQYLQVNTINTGNNTISLVTPGGTTLVGATVNPLSFTTSGNIVPSSYYPGGGLNGIIVGGTTDIAAGGGAALGGELGALITLRDQTLPTYNAQLDELAQKTATRFSQEGMTLFTNASGTVPASTAPPTPVGYVGFAGQIQVNPAIVANPALLQSGTTGQILQPNDPSVINRVSQYAFGPYAYQQGTGTSNISAGTLFATLGLTQVNQVVGNTDIAALSPNLSAAAGLTLPAQFNLTVGATTHIITINPGDTASNLANNINAIFGSSIASIDGLGQLALNTTANVTLADISTGVQGMASLGFAFGTYNASNPSFQVQVGSQTPVTVSITAATTAATLLSSLNAITGLTASLNGAGQLVLIPTNGGSLTLADGAGAPLTAMGMNVTNIAPTAFRQTDMGPSNTLSSGLVSNATLGTYASSIMTAQAEDAQNADTTATQEQSYLQTLQQNQSNTSGVNIDQEMAKMIQIQSNYTAAARMITASQTMLTALINAFSNG